MIFIHVSAYFLNNQLIRNLWDYTHFAVPLFVFCSAYLFFKTEKVKKITKKYILKRVKRLIVPYYIFIIISFAIDLLLGRGFSLTSFVEKLFLFKGRDLSWLVVLFLYFILLLPIINFMYQKTRKIFWLFMLASFATSVFLIFNSVDIGFRYIMWLGWSFFLGYTLLFANSKNKKFFILSSLIVSGLTFLISRDFIIVQGKNLTLTENKYPPNIFYIAYGIFFTSLFYSIHKYLLSKSSFFIKNIQAIFDFMSKNSYSMFFIHFIFVRILTGTNTYKTLGIWWFFVIVTVFSTITQILINSVKRKLLSFYIKK